MPRYKEGKDLDLSQPQGPSFPGQAAPMTRPPATRYEPATSLPIVKVGCSVALVIGLFLFYLTFCRYKVRSMETEFQGLSGGFHHAMAFGSEVTPRHIVDTVTGFAEEAGLEVVRIDPIFLRVSWTEEPYGEDYGPEVSFRRTRCHATRPPEYELMSPRGQAEFDTMVTACQVPEWIVGFRAYARSSYGLASREISLERYTWAARANPL
jgi:hypothetical protein